MSADLAPVSVPLPSLARLAQYWHTAKVVAKTIVVLLAIFGAAQLTAPLRADAASPGPTSVSSTTAPGKAVTPGK